MISKTPTIFFGASKFVIPTISFLQENYDLKLVITTEIGPTDSIPTYCKENNIPCISLESFKDPLWITWKEKIKKWSLDFAVLAYFGLIIPQEIIDMFPKGIINIHPSRLPQYRGPTPGQTAILLGDIKTGVSIMLLDKEVDHGPVLAQKEEKILPTDSAKDLYKRLFATGVDLLEAALPSYLSGELKPVEQHHNNATFTKTLTRESGFIDTTKPIPQGLLDRTIRAFYPWPGAWTKWHMKNGKEKIIKLLPGKHIQVEGKKPMSYKDFINGYPESKEFLKKLQLL